MVEVAGGVWESGWIGSAACVAVLARDESRGATSCSLLLAPTQSLRSRVFAPASSSSHGSKLFGDKNVKKAHQIMQKRRRNL